MQTLAAGVATYRTKCLPIDQAGAFARCLRGNENFAAVTIERSGRAKGESCWFVQFVPANPERTLDMLAREGEKRAATAQAEGEGYIFTLDKDAGRAFAWCFNPKSGATYQTTERSCSCPDQQFRACPEGCKHQQALRSGLGTVIR